MEWTNVTDAPATSAQRQSIYKFVFSNQTAVRTLIGYLTANEAASILDGLVNADQRRQGLPVRSQQRIIDAEIDAILTG